MSMVYVDPEDGETVKDGAKLKRPWTVFIFGVIAAVGEFTFIFARTRDNSRFDNEFFYGLMGFAILTLVLSAMYAFIGARYSLALARRILGIIGLILIFGAIGFIKWMISWV